MQYATPLAVIGALSMSLIIAVAAQLSSPQHMLQQPMWPMDMPLMLQLQNDPARPLELKTSVRSHHHHTGHHHHHRSPGKPGADVALTGPGVRTLVLGEVRSLELAIQSHMTDGTLQIQLETSQDLQMVSGTHRWDFELNGTQTLSLPIAVQALAEGQHYVHVFIEHVSDDGARTTRALATEFRVGDSFATRAYAKHFSKESGSEYRALPANEVIY